jgi:hypothetical protein
MPEFEDELMLGPDFRDPGDPGGPSGYDPTAL